MSMPGFAAEASLYRANQHYIAASSNSEGSLIPQALPVGLSGSQLYWCRLACAYCHHYGYACWYCYICAWIIVLGNETSPAAP